MPFILFSEEAITKYFEIIDKFAIIHFKWTFLGSTDNFPKDKLSDTGLSQGNHDDNIHTAQLYFHIWKQLHQMVMENKNHYQGVYT